MGKESAFLKVSKDIPVEYAASMSVNLCTAWRMLHDFVSLSPGVSVALSFRTLPSPPNLYW